MTPGGLKHRNSGHCARRERQCLQGDKQEFLKLCRPGLQFTYELRDLEKAV